MSPSAPASPSLLDQLDVLVTASRVQPAQCELQPLLTLLLQAIAPLPLAEQLAIAGSVFDQLAGVVDARAQLLFASWESWHGTQSPVVDLSGDTELFVQSQSLAVADLFAPPLRAPYTHRAGMGRGDAFADQQESELDGLGWDGLGLGLERLGLGACLSGTEDGLTDGTLAGEGHDLMAGGELIDVLSAELLFSGELGDCLLVDFLLLRHSFQCGFNAVHARLTPHDRTLVGRGQLSQCFGCHQRVCLT